MQTMISIAELPPLEGPKGLIPGRFLFEGALFGLDHLTLVMGETEPGCDIPLHRHAYEELFIVYAGRGTYTVGDAIVEAGPGDVVLIRSGVPHRFANNGRETLVHTAVHATGIYGLEYLE
jgi:mannose-6-phosphate isomerase-like protein (cupin superfamily)